VQTGIGAAFIVPTGKDTAFGETIELRAIRPPETEFGRGICHFGLMVLRSSSESVWLCSCDMQSIMKKQHDGARPPREVAQSSRSS
jgi:hypothetical protein